MLSFNYPVITKLIYRYANIPLNMLLLFYFISGAMNLSEKVMFIIPMLITLVFIILLNRQYYVLYKILPYKIIADGEKLICEDFLFSKRKVVVYYKDITALKGGVFEGKISGLMKVCDEKNKTCIAFFNRLKNVNKLQTEILGRVNKEVYDAVVEKVGLRRKKAEEHVAKFKEKKNSKKKK